MTRFRNKSIQFVHTSFGDASISWKFEKSTSLKNYCFEHGVAHLLSVGKVTAAERLLTDFDYYMARFKQERKTAALGVVVDVSALHSLGGLENPSEFAFWEDFFRTRVHILANGELNRAPEKILLQLAMEHADDSPVTFAAQAWLGEGNCNWFWLRRRKIPSHATKSALKRVIKAHQSFMAYRGVTDLGEGRFVSRDYNGGLTYWSLNSTEPLFHFQSQHNADIAELVSLSPERFLILHKDGVGHLWALSYCDVHECITPKPMDWEIGHPIVGVKRLQSEQFLTWSTGGKLTRWSTRNGDRLALMVGYSSVVKGVIELQNRQVVTWVDSTDNDLQVWDENGVCSAVLSGHTNRLVGALELFNGCLLSWDLDKNLQCWSMDTGKLLTTIPLGFIEWPMTTMKIIEVSENLLCLWSDKSEILYVFSVEEPSKRLELYSHQAVVSYALRLSGDRLATCSYDGLIMIWNIQTGQLLCELKDHIRPVNGMLELEDNFLVSWGWDGCIRKWDLQEGKCLGVLARYNEDAQGLEVLYVSPDTLLSWVSKDIWVWDANGELGADSLPRHNGRLTHLSIFGEKCVSWSDDRSNDDNYLRFARGIVAKDHAVWIWNTNEKGRPIKLDSFEPKEAWLCNDGSCLVVEKNKDIQVSLWDSGTGCLLRRLRLPIEGYFVGATFSKNDVLVCWTTTSMLSFQVLTQTSQFYDLKRIKQPKKVWCTAKYLLATNDDNELFVWGLKDGQLLVSLMGHKRSIQQAGVLSDGRVFSWDNDFTLRLWDLTSQTSTFIWQLPNSFWHHKIRDIAGLFLGYILLQTVTGEFYLLNPKVGVMVTTDQLDPETFQYFQGIAQNELLWDIRFRKLQFNHTESFRCDPTGKWSMTGTELTYCGNQNAIQWCTDATFMPQLLTAQGEIYGVDNYSVIVLELFLGEKRWSFMQQHSLV